MTFVKQFICAILEQGFKILWPLHLGDHELLGIAHNMRRRRILALDNGGDFQSVTDGLQVGKKKD